MMQGLTFIKVQAASIAGSAADYLTTIFLVEYFHLWYLLANFTGNMIGGALLFILCRKWIFHSNKDGVRLQVVKFILTFAGNLLLSAIGVFIITHYFGINYIFSKTMVSVLLGISYNYLMQKNFVFS
jgi:putative flippase GtrA